MAYTKQNFEDGQVLNAEHLNKMEDGIEAASVQTDWNQTDETAADFLKNKPFGEMYGDTYANSMTEEEVEGLINSGKLVADQFLKISDEPVKMSDLENGFIWGIGSEIFEIPPEAIGEAVFEIADGLLLIGEVVVVVDEQAVGVDLEGLIFPEKGTFVLIHGLFLGVTITVPGFGKFKGVNKLDEKYIPAGYKNVPQVQADWNQTDETAVDFIKNKPTSAQIARLGYTIRDGAYIITKDGEEISFEEFLNLCITYGMCNVYISGSPVLIYNWWNGDNPHGTVVTYYWHSVDYAAPRYYHTAEYTPKT